MPPFQPLTYSSKSGRTVKSSPRSQKARETVKLAITGNVSPSPTTPQPSANPTNPRQYIQTYISQQSGGGGGSVPPAQPPSSSPPPKGGKPSSNTPQQGGQANPKQQKALRKVGRRAADALGDKLRAGMEKVSEAPSGDIGLVLIILIFFMFAIYRVDFSGKFTRLQLIMFTLMNQASLVDDSKKVLSDQSSQGGTLPASVGSGQPLESVSNRLLSQAGVPKVSQPPRVTRVPPSPTPNTSETST